MGLRNRSEDAPSLAEIEITHEMSEAGIDALAQGDDRFEDSAAIVARIYRAMVSAILEDLVLEQFGKNGWFFGMSKTVPGVLLCAPTAKEVIAQFPHALAMVQSARAQDEALKTAV